MQPTSNKAVDRKPGGDDTGGKIAQRQRFFFLTKSVFDGDA